MWTDSDERKMYELLLQCIIVNQKKQQQIKNGVCSSTGSISEGCFVKYFTEKRIKEVQYVFNCLFQNIGLKLQNIGSMFFGISCPNSLMQCKHFRIEVSYP